MTPQKRLHRELSRKVWLWMTMVMQIMLSIEVEAVTEQKVS